MNPTILFTRDRAAGIIIKNKTFKKYQSAQPNAVVTEKLQKVYFIIEKVQFSKTLIPVSILLDNNTSILQEPLVPVWINSNPHKKLHPRLLSPSTSGLFIEVFPYFSKGHSTKPVCGKGVIKFKADQIIFGLQNSQSQKDSSPLYVL